jgi:Dolichyl-phosphate-mannose-protein mannosyltransferase
VTPSEGWRDGLLSALGRIGRVRECVVDERGPRRGRADRLRRWGVVAWVAAIAGFAALHAWHLRADFPNGSPWVFDWAKFTDEGWYGAAAIRAHLFGHWYLAGDFNSAVVLPVWPFVEWVLFFFTGVTVEAARGLAVGCYFVSLALTYLLLRGRGPRWMALLAVTLAVTSPFLYCFNRLAILEPLETTLTLVALNLAVRLPKMKRPVLASVGIGLLFASMLLTKTTAAFLAPAVGWAMIAPLWEKRWLALKCALAGAASAAVGYGAWMALIDRAGLMGDYVYFFAVANSYPMPQGHSWLPAAFWWSFHGLLWIDHSLAPLAVLLALGAALAWRAGWARRLWRDPVFGAAILGIMGLIGFMTMKDHPQPRYFVVPAFLVFIVVAMGAAALVEQTGWGRKVGWAVVAAVAIATGVHGMETMRYAMHPEYTWVNAATELTHYIDTHPNGKRLMVSTSGDEITLVTHLPTICDELSTEDLAEKLGRLEPGWFSSWNDIDPNTLADLHARYSLEQVAKFPAFDDPDRNVLVLFKLHPLPGGKVRDFNDPRLSAVLPDDEVEVPVE